MSFLAFASDMLVKQITGLAGRELGEKIKEIRTSRRMARLVEDAVDRVVYQMEGYLRSENLDFRKQEVLISAICARIQPLVDDPQQFFEGNLDGAQIFSKCHPAGKLPQEIREEKIDQFYTVLFPQVAHLIAGSRVALAQWQAEGFREEFKRLNQIAEEIRGMNAKVADLPAAVVNAFDDKVGQEAEMLLRQFVQTYLSTLLLKLDLSPLRAERFLHGALGEHFVAPAIKERTNQLEFPLFGEERLQKSLAGLGVRCVLHGVAGMGKTTCAIWLAANILKADPTRLAVVFRLRDVKDIEERSVLELLRSIAGPHLKDLLTAEILRRWYETGRLVLIFDGFDEIPEHRRDLVENWLIKLEVVAKSSALLITSRPLQSGHLAGLLTSHVRTLDDGTALREPWKQWELQPFDEARIVEFIERWHLYLPEGELSSSDRSIDAHALARIFFSDPTLKSLADTPLMLSTLLFVHHRDKKLPSGRVDLYERYISAMLGLRDSGLGIQARATKLNDSEKRRVLAHIALHFHLKGIQQENDATMLLLVSEGLKVFNFEEDPQKLLAALGERTGLLQGPGTWAFIHKTVGEFLMAELVCNGTTRLADQRRLDRMELWNHREEDEWIAVLFFWAGMTTPRELEEFIRDLLSETKGEATLLALSLIRDQGDRMSHMSQRGLVERLIKCPIPLSKQEQSSAICHTPCVPGFAYVEYAAPHYRLPGLANVASTHALCELFSKKLVSLKDLESCHISIQAAFVIAHFWALANDANLPVSDTDLLFKRLPRRDLALYMYNATCDARFYRPNVDDQSRESFVSSWESAFPEGRGWVPILLLGHIAFSRSVISTYQIASARKVCGPLLWRRINQAIDRDWLLDSRSCRAYGLPMRSDLFYVLPAEESTEAAEDWGLTNSQFNELKSWSASLVRRRADLEKHH